MRWLLLNSNPNNNALTLYRSHQEKKSLLFLLLCDHDNIKRGFIFLLIPSFMFYRPLPNDYACFQNITLGQNFIFMNPLRLYKMKKIKLDCKNVSSRVSLQQPYHNLTFFCALQLVKTQQKRRFNKHFLTDFCIFTNRRVWMSGVGQISTYLSSLIHPYTSISVPFHVRLSCNTMNAYEERLS